MTRIRFTEPQLALFKRAHPDADLESLIDVTFEFDRKGRLVDCFGTVEGAADPAFNDNPWLSTLCNLARERLAKLPASGAATIVQFPGASNA